jgi:F-type H+-transporting ATPase subunit delta
MKPAKQSRREAGTLFRLCLVDGSLDEDRARRVARRLIEAGRPGTLLVLSRFQRLVRLDVMKHRADVTSAVPLGPELRARLEAGIARVHGPGIVTTFVEDPALLGGVRVAVGSDVFDGSIKAGLAALAERM